MISKCIAVAMTTVAIIILLFIYQSEGFRLVNTLTFRKENTKRISGGEEPKEGFKFYNPTLIRRGDDYHVIHRHSNFTFWK
jgi:hypothetical protein